MFPRTTSSTAGNVKLFPQLKAGSGSRINARRHMQTRSRVTGAQKTYELRPENFLTVLLLHPGACARHQDEVWLLPSLQWSKKRYVGSVHRLQPCPCEPRARAIRSTLCHGPVKNRMLRVLGLPSGEFGRSQRMVIGDEEQRATKQSFICICTTTSSPWCIFNNQQPPFPALKQRRVGGLYPALLNGHPHGYLTRALTGSALMKSTSSLNRLLPRSVSVAPGTNSGPSLLVSISAIACIGSTRPATTFFFFWAGAPASIIGALCRANEQPGWLRNWRGSLKPTECNLPSIRFDRKCTCWAYSLI